MGIVARETLASRKRGMLNFLAAGQAIWFMALQAQGGAFLGDVERLPGCCISMAHGAFMSRHRAVETRFQKLGLG